jgi:hypothetical protein
VRRVFLRSGFNLELTNGCTLVVGLGFIKFAKPFKSFISISEEHAFFGEDFEHGGLSLGDEGVFGVAFVIDQEIGDDFLLFFVLNVFEFLHEHFDNFIFLFEVVFIGQRELLLG